GDCRRRDNARRFADGVFRHGTGVKASFEPSARFACVTARDKACIAAKPLAILPRQRPPDIPHCVPVQWKFPGEPANTVGSKEFLHKDSSIESTKSLVI